MLGNEHQDGGSMQVVGFAGMSIAELQAAIRDERLRLERMAHMKFRTNLEEQLRKLKANDGSKIRPKNPDAWKDAPLKRGRAAKDTY